MSPRDVLVFAWRAVRAHKVRTRLTAAAIAVGIAAVLILTSLGHGAEEYVLGQFRGIGSNLVIIMPGKTETSGGPPMAPGTTRDLTMGDMLAIRQTCPRVRYVAPISIGEATVEAYGKGRSCVIAGTGYDFLRVRSRRVAVGQFLPEGDAGSEGRICVLGPFVARELFGERNPLGERVRIGQWRFRVIGIFEPAGEQMGMNLDEVAVIPVLTAMQMFNRKGLFRILLQSSTFAEMDGAKEEITRLLKERHDGEEDFTILTHGSVVEELGKMIRILTLAAAAIASISLAVAGVGVMNVMVISVAERTSEIGLLKAVGAGRGQILAVFLAEATAISLLGGGLGVGIGLAAVWAFGEAVPWFPISAPLWAIEAALGVSLGVGILFGILPAVAASRKEPLAALGRGL